MSNEIYIEFHSRWFYIPAMITIAFLVASFGVKDCYKRIRGFMNILDEDQKKIYMEIRKERENTYWCALMQGCFVAILYIIMSTLTCSSKSLYHLISDILCLIFTTTYFVYTLKGKKKIMLIDAEMDETQDKKWVEIYRCMQRNFWSYFLMGLLVSGFVFSMLDILTPPIQICINPKKTPPRPKKKK